MMAHAPQLLVHDAMASTLPISRLENEKLPQKLGCSYSVLLLHRIFKPRSFREERPLVTASALPPMLLGVATHHAREDGENETQRCTGHAPGSALRRLTVLAFCVKGRMRVLRRTQARSTWSSPPKVDRRWPTPFIVD